MDRIDDARHNEPRLANAPLGFLDGDAAGTIQLDAVEAQVLEKLKLFQQRLAGLDHVDFYGLLEFLLSRLVVSRSRLPGQIGQSRGGRTSDEQIASSDGHGKVPIGKMTIRA